MKAAEKTVKNDAVTKWVHDYGDELYSWANHKVSDEVAAQDLVQDTFIAALQNFENFKGASSPKTWLFTILKNKIIDHYRKNARFEITHPLPEHETAVLFDEHDRWKESFRPKPWDENDELLDNPEFKEVLSKCMGKLPAAWSSCLQLKYLTEKESVDICQQLNITASNLWQILHRAKLQLRNCLEKKWFND